LVTHDESPIPEPLPSFVTVREVLLGEEGVRRLFLEVVTLLDTLCTQFRPHGADFTHLSGDLIGGEVPPTEQNVILFQVRMRHTRVDPIYVGDSR